MDERTARILEVIALGYVVIVAIVITIWMIIQMVIFGFISLKAMMDSNRGISNEG